MKNRRLRYFVWITIGMVCVFLLVFDYACQRFYQAWIRQPHGRVAHPIYDHSFRPNASWQDRYGPYVAPYFSNSLGFRDGEIRDVLIKSGKDRILLIGDSFTDGVGVAWKETFAGRLQAQLAPKGIEILNGGCNSYTPILERIKIQYWIEDHGLTIERVVLFLDTSDVKDELFYEDAKGRAILIPYGPFASHSGWGTWVEYASEFSENQIEPNFALLGAVSRNIKLWIRKLARKEMGKRGVFTNQEIPAWMMNWEYSGPEKKIVAAGIQKLKKNLGELANFLRQRNIPMTLVVYPYPEHLKQRPEKHAIPRIWRPWAQENGVEFVDLFPVFQELGSPEQTTLTYFLKGDGHWNAEGHRVVAETLLKNKAYLETFSKNTRNNKEPVSK